MKQLKFFALFLILILETVSLAEVPQVISYQGRLNDTGTGETVDGTHDITFNLYDSETGISSPLWTETHRGVTLSDGYFNVFLGSVNPFGSEVDFSEQYWLGVSIDGNPEMAPRFRLSASPYALNIPSMGAEDGQVLTWNGYLGKWVPQFLESAGCGACLTDSSDTCEPWLLKDEVLYTATWTGAGGQKCSTAYFGVAKGNASNDINGETKTHVNLGASSLTGDADPDSFCTITGGLSNIDSASYGFIGGGKDNVIEDISKYSTICGGSGNTTTSMYAFIGGGISNLADSLYTVVCGGYDNEAYAQGSAVCGGTNNYAGDNYSFVGGGHDNSASSRHCAITGGYDNDITATWSENSCISGGRGNDINGVCSVISGGYYNNINLGIMTGYSTIGGGNQNIITASHSTIAGGSSNADSSDYGFIGGGRDNLISFANSTEYGTIAGGRSNVVIGIYSTVCGGYDNQAGNGVVGDEGAFVGGGRENFARTQYATIAGGLADTAVGIGAFIGAGNHNVIENGDYSVISGGQCNRMIGSGVDWCVIPGGRSNAITEDTEYSLAFGRKVVVSQDYVAAFFSDDTSGSYRGKLSVNEPDPHSTLHYDDSEASAYTTKNANYTLTTNDHSIFTINVITITLPDADAFGGRIYYVRNTDDTDNLTLNGGGDNIEGGASITIPPNEGVIVQSDGDDWWVIADYTAHY